MKKFLAVIMAAVLLLSVSLPVFAISGEDLLKGALITVINEAVKQEQNKNKNSKSETKPKTQNETPQPSVTKSEAEPTKSYSKEEFPYSELGYSIYTDLTELAQNIIAYNKPAFEIKLNKKERTVEDEDGKYVTPFMYNKVWVKGKTIVIGIATEDKSFFALNIITAEPGFPPEKKNKTEKAPYVCVGQDVSVIENYAGTSVQNVSEEEGRIHFDPLNLIFVDLKYKNGKITEIQKNDFNNGEAVAKRTWDFAKKKAKQLGLTFQY